MTAPPRHAGYAVSQRKRKLVEQGFGWMKTIGGLRKLRHRGGALVNWIFTFTAAAYNIVRMHRLLPAARVTDAPRRGHVDSRAARAAHRRSALDGYRTEQP